jgi:cytochrome d ubiquinol oxidase subunit I
MVAAALTSQHGVSDPLFWHRLQFAFTVTFHYLFPQLTMGLALIVLLFRLRAFRGNAQAGAAARFWTKVLGVNFVVGVVTGIPLEFQFGTNWARFSQYAGGVVGQTLAMEGTFAFFLESAFLGLVLYGEKKLGRVGHLAATAALFLGSWLSGYFIIATNAFMQHPVGHLAADGALQLASFWDFVLNEWAGWQFAHNMCASVVTASFVVAGIGAFWTLLGREQDATASLRMGVTLGLIACVLQLFPTGDRQGKLVARHQPVALAAMEAVFEGGPAAPLAIIGQPNLETRTLDNPIYLPAALSFLAYGSFGSTVKGLSDFPSSEWPDNIELLYYAYHIMVGLGTLFIALMGAAGVQLWRGRLAASRPLLWALMLAIPFPYIANTAGWTVAELGRQPWIIYGLMRTADATSPRVGAGDAAFTTLGFCGLYAVLSLLFLFLVGREIAHGPEHAPALPPPAPAPSPSPALEAREP